MVNNSVEKVVPSLEARQNIERMIELLKVRAAEGRGRDLNYVELAQWLTQRSGIAVNKDELWRTATGSFKKAPSWDVLTVLARVEEFTFLDGVTHPDLDQISQVFLGELDAYGKPTKNPAK